jgi:hypothetical protein
MKRRRHSWRKRLLTLIAVVAVGVLASQGVVAGLHLGCHADHDPAGPVQNCAVCAHFWLNPAVPVAVTMLPPPASAVTLPSPGDHLSPSAPLVRACVRAPPTLVS